MMHWGLGWLFDLYGPLVSEAFYSSRFENINSFLGLSKLCFEFLFLGA